MSDTVIHAAHRFRNPVEYPQHTTHIQAGYPLDMPELSKQDQLKLEAHIKRLEEHLLACNLITELYMGRGIGKTEGES